MANTTQQNRVEGDVDRGIARIRALAEDVFVDSEKANNRLRQPLGILDGRAPLDVARTEAGARIVEQLLGQIAWGAAA